MRFIINREQFFKGLSIAGKPVPSKGALPILLFIKLDLDEEGLTITGTNGDLSIAYTIPTMIGDKEIIRNTRYGSVLLQSKFITEIAKKLSGEELCFEVIDEIVAKIDDENSSFKLNCLRAQEFPDIDFTLEDTVFEVGCNEFATMVEQTAFAASTKEQKPVLTALNLKAEEGQLTAVATDGSRLAKKTIQLNDSVNFVANIPAHTISDIVRLFENADKTTISVAEKKVIFSFGNTMVRTSVIPNEYPRTQSAFPRTFNYYLEVNAQELINAIDRVSLVSIEKANVVKMTMSEDGVEVASKTAEIGSAVEKISTFQYSGERLSVVFYGDAVAAAIKALKCEDVTICFAGDFKPFVIKNPNDESIIQLVVTLRNNG